MERDSGTFATKRAYFDAFPATFVDFKNTFGYEDALSEEANGLLYEESLEYISAFFNLYKDINLFDFSNKAIRVCLGGEWRNRWWRSRASWFSRSSCRNYYRSRK